MMQRCSMTPLALALIIISATAVRGQESRVIALSTQKSPPPSLLDKPVSFEVKDVTVAFALMRLHEVSGVDISFSPTMLPRHARVNCGCTGVTLERALERILFGTGFIFTEIAGHIAIVRQQPPPPPLPRFTRATLLLANPFIETVSVQETVVAGIVRDAETSQPIQRAAVSVQGTEHRTATNAQGQFLLEGLQGPTVTLEVQLIGYTTVTRDVPVGTEDLEIELEQTAIKLEQIVVSALGIDRARRTLGYSVSRATTEDMTVNRTPNFMDALQGKLAGVTITQLGSGPQGSSKVRIRGQSSFGANNSPLIVVNGLPIDNTTFGVSGDFDERGSNRNSDSGDGLSSINPDDIAEMTVLKGAAASALYGARAKDGVIMITTKNRAAGTGFQVEFNSNFTTESPLDYRDYQMEYGQGEGGVRPHPDNGIGSFPTAGVWSFGERFEPGMTQVLFDGVEVPYAPQPDQFDEYYRSGLNMTNTLTVSQGGDNGGVSVSLGNLVSRSILPGSEYTRRTVNVGFTQRFLERFNIAGNINYSNEVRDNPPNIAEQDYSPVVIYTLSTSMPMWLLREKAFTEEGDEMLWSRFTNRTNPYFALSRFENNVRDRVYGNITGSANLTDWLSVQARIGQDYFTRDQEYNLPTGSQRQAPAPPGFVNGQYVQDQLVLREINADFLVRANQSWDDFGLDVATGGNMMRRRQERKNVLVQDFYARGSYTLGNGRVLDPAFSLSERQVNSLYGSAQVSYRNMAFVTATARNDWFSTLSPENRSILYPSVAGSIVFTDALQLPVWFTFGKLRAAYAEVGSDTDVPPYSNNLFYGIDSNLYGDKPLGGISGNAIPNPELRPMRLSEWEIGVEATLFDRLTLELGYYQRTASDQILNQQVSNASGFTTRRINAGSNRNRGVELLAGLTLGDPEGLRWSGSFNGSYNASKVLDLGEDLSGEPITEITVGDANFHGELRQVVGQPMNKLYGWGWLRDEQGRQVFDANGIPLRSEDQIALGDALPKWVGGITNRFDYRGLSLSFLIDFKLGHKLISGTHTNAVRHGLDKSTLVGREEGCVVGDGVTEDGSVNATCAPVQQFYESIRTFRIAEASVFNAGSWQLRQITLGYDFTPHLPDFLGISGLSASLVARNVAVLKKWVPHIHPDQNGIISDARMGLESTGLPVTRGIGLNVNVEF